MLINIPVGMLFLNLLLLVYIPISSDACTPISDIMNGYFSASKGHGTDSVVTFRCKEGYALYGYMVAICKSDGEWTSTAPKCYKMCNKPSRVTIHGPFIRRHSFIIKVSCPPGFTAPNDGVAECKYGTWWMGSTKGITCSPSTVTENSGNPIIESTSSKTTSKSEYGVSSNEHKGTHHQHQEPADTGHPSPQASQQKSSGNSSQKNSWAWCSLSIAVTALYAKRYNIS